VSETDKGRPHIHAVPWKTPTEEKVKGALGEVPAYVRRARNLEQAVADLFRDAAKAREEMLGFVALRFRQVLDVLDEDTARELDVSAVAALGVILAELEPLPAFYRLKSRARPPRGAREVERTVAALRESVGRFNTRWERWIDEEAPLAEVNRQVDGYNRHYEFERQCALKYVPLDKVTFEKRAPLDRADLLERLPVLPLP
jgi:hypothetical protein